ncbi:uncharacterized protein LOC134707262 [Mytilus trossulus]|uniref:uncharacterized protein LOC134707262 n=1 Tax=Mytilus trossulus TaxID=6551 RepID=UPI003005F867
MVFYSDLVLYLAFGKCRMSCPQRKTVNHLILWTVTLALASYGSIDAYVIQDQNFNEQTQYVSQPEARLSNPNHQYPNTLGYVSQNSHQSDFDQQQNILLQQLHSMKNQLPNLDMTSEQMQQIQQQFPQFTNQLQTMSQNGYHQQPDQYLNQRHQPNQQGGIEYQNYRDNYKPDPPKYEKFLKTVKQVGFYLYQFWPLITGWGII